MLLDKCNEQVRKLLIQNDALKNPLIRGFLKDEENLQSFQKAILLPSQENRNQVEEKFKNYYEKVRIFSYFNSLIKYYAIDFDKRLRKIKNRFTLTLDKPLENEENNTETLKTMIPDQKSDENISSIDKTLKDEVADERLYNSLNVLTDTQYKILELIYVKNLSKKEIAEIINSTPQNVTNIHRKALRKLRKHYGGE